ncbi:conserved hypothetical protein [Leishmania braziliensis MHOM/BR/75/M2904]|uniref:Uncharacterized protein n=2 Tax=Leishmania braziliensis TaxID=5660 RepID=A4HGF2_LEIBR|nr:conserved hypothetical protein [Leishmania braziliensis MHOM/BR/75/M2904]CAJ2475783.1 unnamed protein product [Leishmania braziliensis]CAM39645.2 conserved hypothetical protein [Leishmania braziliensis MHOM/BR/75/M2904]SYZ67304.1 hypothetical_protein [Leishmania braziliensis MHOM/BR/75/M2904]
MSSAKLRVRVTDMLRSVARRTSVQLGTGAACLAIPSPSVVSPRLQVVPSNPTGVTSVRAFPQACHLRIPHTPSILPCGSLSTARRCVTLYPKASRRVVRNGKKKHFNYLTADRMLPPEKKLSRLSIRNRDDVSLRRRRDYKQQLVRDVEEKIHFFPPSIKKQVFFPLMTNSTRVRLFRGNREYGLRMSTRVFSMLLDQLCKRENRDFILEQLGKLGLELPTAEDWEHFADPVTGDITTGIMYSNWVHSVLTTYGRMSFTGSTHLLAGGATTLFAYVIRNYFNRTLVPPLEDWSRQFGPVAAEEFLGRPRGQQKVSLAMSEAVCEVRVWGRTQAQEGVSRLSLQEQDDLVKWVKNNLKSHIVEMERKNAFASKVLAVLHSLPEAKAVNNSFWVFKEARRLEHVIKLKGAFFPRQSRVRSEWRQLSMEERARYSCFGQKRQTETACGRKLFIRYCCRDYGFSLSNASQRYTTLGDLQKAALDFPFYFPLTPSNAATAAFHRFYVAMCDRYGMVRTYNNGIGNRLFKAAMREKWDALSMEERQQYEDHDQIYAVFPLQPTTGEAVSGSAETSTSSESLPTKTAPSAVTQRSEGLTTRWGKPAKLLTQTQPVKIGPQYFVEERPPSLKVDDTALTAETLLLNLRQAAYGKRRRGRPPKLAATDTQLKATPAGAETAAVADEQPQSQKEKEAGVTQDMEVPAAALMRNRGRRRTSGVTQGEGSTRTLQSALQVVII